MSRRRFLAAFALFTAALLLATAIPHIHASPGGLAKDDCVLCHAHYAPFVASHATGSVTDFTFAAGLEPVLDDQERDAALGCHPSRAPPA